MSQPSNSAQLIRASWALAATDPARTAQTFYANLFRIDPSTKALFVSDLDLQGRKLTDTLAFIVDHLEDADILLPAAQDLARRHVAYGVTKPQYDAVGAALIKTFEQLLGPQFTPDHSQAWAETYAGLARAMTDAAYAA